MTEEPRLSGPEYLASLKPHPDSANRPHYLKFDPDILKGGLVGEMRIDQTTASQGKYTGRTEGQAASK